MEREKNVVKHGVFRTSAVLTFVIPDQCVSFRTPREGGVCVGRNHPVRRGVRGARLVFRVPDR
jgi:hypothetical protein